MCEKLVKMLGVCRNWIFGQKFDFLNSVILKRDIFVGDFQILWQSVKKILANFLFKILYGYVTFVKRVSSHKFDQF